MGKLEKISATLTGLATLGCGAVSYGGFTEIPTNLAEGILYATAGLVALSATVYIIKEEIPRFSIKKIKKN